MTGRQKQASAIVARLRRRTREVHAETLRFRYRPSVFVVLGAAPIWTSGSHSYISTLIALAGGRNAAGDLGAAYAEYSAETLLRRQPDVLVADPATNIAAFLYREPWRSLRAVQRHRVYAFDPDRIERPGPNYVTGLSWLFAHIAPLAESAAR